MVNDKWQGPFRVYYSGRSTWSDKAMFEQAQPRTGQPREAAQSTYYGSYDVLSRGDLSTRIHRQKRTLHDLALLFGLCLSSYRNTSVWPSSWLN